MNIYGLQKMTLLDYPGKVACTVFTAGCNFRCPFCHNAPLVTDIDASAPYTDTDIIEFLKKRRGLLDGVCITGGEPLMMSEIGELITSIKALGFLVKLDTNGTYPDRLKALMDENLIDTVAMDVKNSKDKYMETAGVTADFLPKIEESMGILINGNVDFEFRTTVVDGMHTVRDIEEIAKWITGAKKYFLQPFSDSGDTVSKTPMKAPDSEVLQQMRDVAGRYIPVVSVRGNE